MLRSMFGMGGTEILVILIVALLFLGPDKLPDAAKKISKGIRDIKKQSRVLQQTIEDDENIGGAIRDLKSALRGEDEPIRPRPIKPKQIEAVVATAATAALPEPSGEPEAVAAGTSATEAVAAGTTGAEAVAAGTTGSATETGATESASAKAVTDVSGADGHKPVLSMPAMAGEPDHAVPATTAGDDAELAALVKPAPNTIARSASVTAGPAVASPGPAAPAAAITPPAPPAPAAPAAPETPETSEPEHG
jgi:sec-independent protein translocase protein TatB